MTKKLEELFNLPEIPEDAVPDTESTFHSIDENRAILRDVDDAIDYGRMLILVPATRAACRC